MNQLFFISAMCLVFSKSNGVGTHSARFGTDSEALADNSVSMGKGTQADHFASLIIGQYNVRQQLSNVFNSSNSAFVVGNGLSEQDTSNALELNFKGDLRLSGDLTIQNGVSLQQVYDRLIALENRLMGCDCSANIFMCNDTAALKAQYNTMLNEQNTCQ